MHGLGLYMNMGEDRREWQIAGPRCACIKLGKRTRRGRMVGFPSSRVVLVVKALIKPYDC
jgi:hypothetical protein